MAPAAQVVVVGSFNVDHVWRCAQLPRPGQTLAGRYASGPGGKGFNQATAAARAGATTLFACALGDDAGARLAASLARGDGIDLRAHVVAAPTGTAGIFVDAQGRNSIVAGPGANALLPPAFVAGLAAPIAAAGVLLAQLESPPEAVAHALELARAAATTTILNPAPADAGTTPELLALSDILTPNESEFAALLARHAGLELDADTVAACDDDRLHGFARALLPGGTVVLTLGGAGVFVSHPHGERRGDAQAWYRLAAETVDAVDTTGAGDAFNGALAAALVRAPAAPFAHGVRFANRYAALSTQAGGAAAAMPALAQLHARFGPD